MKTRLWIAALILIAVTASMAAEPNPLIAGDAKRLIAELEQNLQEHILKPWFPRCVDKARGGFIQDYAEDWTESRDGNKTLVYQARLTWMAAQVALSKPELAKEYLEYSNHGLDFLADKMWDEKNGGFFWNVDANGKPTGERKNEKHVYGISFGLYAASVNYKATKNLKALELAKKTFDWLEKHAADGEKNGYFEALTVSGTQASGEGSDWIGTAYGYKSMNTHIHMLESLTAFYEVCPTAVVKSKLHSIYNIVHDKICVNPEGVMHLYFHNDWTPVPDLDSFGHDLETAYLLIEAAEALGLGIDRDPLPSALVKHALVMGWDETHGGFYDEGGTFRKAIVTDKVWWVQAEGLNAFSLMYAKQLKASKIWDVFLKQWEFIQKFQIDHKNGGWITSVSAEGVAKPGQSKSDQWKEPYHQGRAVLNVIERLKKLSGEK